MQPSFDLPEVGALASEGDPVFQCRKPSTPAVMHLLVELHLAGIAQILTDQLYRQALRYRLRRGENQPDEAGHAVGRTPDTIRPQSSNRWQ